LTVQGNLHQAQAQALYDLKKRVKLHCQSFANITAIVFDFMQNLPVPNMTTNKVLYSRQAWHYVFGIHNIGTCEVVMYTYHEGEETRGQNDVTSMLLHYLKNNLPADTSELWLFSDGCSEQNKNRVMLQFANTLVHRLKIVKVITHVFPVRGLSYLPCDGDF
jgi:hypothetical protein